MTLPSIEASMRSSEGLCGAVRSWSLDIGGSGEYTFARSLHQTGGCALSNLILEDFPCAVP